MQELDLSAGRIIAVLWLIFWRWTLGGVVLGGVAGGIIGFVMGIAGMDTKAVALVTGPVGLVVAVFVGFLVVRSALRKQYRDFRIALVPR